MIMNWGIAKMFFKIQGKFCLKNYGSREGTKPVIKTLTQNLIKNRIPPRKNQFISIVCELKRTYLSLDDLLLQNNNVQTNNDYV